MLATVTTAFLRPVANVSGAVLRWRATQNQCFLFRPEAHPLQQCLYVASDEARRAALLEGYQLLQINLEFPQSCEAASTRKLISDILHNLIAAMDAQTRNSIYEYVYHLALPRISGPSWGEDHAFDDLERLVAAMDIVGALGRQPIVCEVWMDWERNLACRAHIWRMDRRPMRPHRFAAFINGLGLSLDGARHDAYQVSDRLLEGEDLYLVYNAAPDSLPAMASTPALHSGVCFPATRRLLELWMHFFWTRRGNSETLLQVCHSQGAAHTRAALTQLPVEFRPRVRILAMAPAAFFLPSADGVQVVHIYKTEDPVLLAAHGFSAMPKGHRSLVHVPHAPDEGNPHNPHTRNYVDAARPYVERWLRTGDLF